MIRFNEAKPTRNLRSMPESLRYTAHDVERQSGESSVDFSSYYVLRLELAPGSAQVVKLKKPLQTVFPSARVCFMTIDKRQAYAVVCHASMDLPSHLNELESACAVFTGQAVNIGISMQGAGGDSLPITFRQADAALEKSFFQPEANVYLFYTETCSIFEQDHDPSELLERLSELVQQGRGEECAMLLEELFHDQQTRLRPSQILAEGSRVMTLCMDALVRVDTRPDTVSGVVRCQSELGTCPTFQRYCDLLRQLMRECCDTVVQRVRTGGNAVLDARSYIEENFHRPISLGEVAAAIGVNPGYLSRSFKSKTGMNLVDSINRKKVGAAKEMLGLGNRKISEVAASIGIEDTAYFSHLFRKYTGMSPRAYQKFRLHGEGPEDQ